MNKETFGFEVEKFEFTRKGVIRGIASKFNSPILHNGMVNIISSQAFDRSLAAGNRVPLLNQHNMLDPVGVINKLAPTEGSLHFEAQIVTESSRGKDVYELVKAGALGGVSIGFVPSVTRYGKDKTGRRVRYIDDLELHEISLVTVPADKHAEVTVVYAEDFDESSVEMDADFEPIGEFDAKGAFALLETRIIKLEETIGVGIKDVKEVQANAEVATVDASSRPSDAVASVEALSNLTQDDVLEALIKKVKQYDAELIGVIE